MNDMLDQIPDDELRHKLQGYSELPDDNLWDKISSGTRESMPLHQRLQHYHEEPEVQVWNGISQGIRAEKSIFWMEAAGRMIAVISILMLVFPFGMNPPWLTEQVVENKVPQYQKFDVESNLIEGISRDKEGIERGETNRIDSVAANFNHSHIQVPEALTQKNISTSGRLQLTARKGDPVGQEVRTKSAEEQSETGQAVLLTDTSATQKLLIIKADQQAGSMKAAARELRGETQSVIVEKDSTTGEQAARTKSSEPENSKKKKNKKPAGVYALLMPTFGYQQIEPVKDDNILIESIEKVSTFSTKRLGIRAEVGVEKELVRKVFIQGGLLYYQRKQTINYTYRDATDPSVNKVAGNPRLYQVSLGQDSSTFEYELRNIGVVAGLNYITTTKKFMHKIGIAAEFQRSLIEPNPEVDTGQRYFLFGDVYYRLSYPISRRFDLIFQPTVNYALQLDNRINAPFYVKPYGLGLNFGAYFHF